jgi:UDP-glucose 4-epimerase
MRVVVTGGTGFLGRAVVDALVRRGHDVTAMQREEAPAGAAFQTVRGDVRDVAALQEAVADADAVCHLAALTKVRESIEKPTEYWSINAGGTINVLTALAATSTRSRPKRLILASTAAVYGTPEQQPISEETTAAPSSPYGASKLAAELAAADAVRTGSLGATSLRAFNIAGSSRGKPDPDRTRLIPKVLAVQAGLAHELTVNGDGTAVRDFTHVEDVAQAFTLALDACAPGQWRAYNIGGARASVAEVIRAAEGVTGNLLPVRHLPPAPEPPCLVADSTRARQELGWQPKKSELSQILRDGWNALTSEYSTTE